MRAAEALAVVIGLFACSKPPKRAVDVDTMREASFVKDIKDDDASGTATPTSAPAPSSGAADVHDDADEPVLAANPGSEMAPALAPAKPARKPSGREKITAAECSRMFDHFFDLMLQSDERFKDLGPDARSMVRQISAQDERFQSMQKDCESDVSRTKFSCAMGSKTSAAWQACVK